MIALILFSVFLAVFVLSIVAGSSATNLSSDFPLQFRVAARLRTTVLMFVVVPLSFAMKTYISVRAAYRRRQHSKGLGGTHAERVELVVSAVRKWNEAGRTKTLRTARPNWLGMSTKLGSNKAASHCVATHHLNHILNVDLDGLLITVEPAVTFGELSHHLVPLGYSLEVHVEMESITVGGVAMGFGMETNCHRSGFFQETVTEYEVILPDASVVKVTAESDPSLFYALPWSHGTLGFLASVTMRLHPVKPYVRVRYIPTSSKAELGKKMHEMSTGAGGCAVPEFLEATVYSKNQAVIQCADFVDPPKSREDKAKINGINWWWKPFYFRWVETFLTKGEAYEYIPYSHFMHRFTRSIFWEIEDMIPFANHPIYRFFWGWMGPPEVSLLKLFQGPVIRKASVYAHVVQESIMPVLELPNGIEKFDSWYGVYPLLVFPLRIYDRKENSGFLNPKGRNLHEGNDWGIWVDLGAYGAPRPIRQGQTWDAKTNIRKMEHWTRDIGGFQALYTDIFATHRELRQMFDHTLLDAARKRVGALDAFPDVYDKVKSEAGIVDLSDIEAAEKLDS
eukprot:NODE_318_length_1903_cov_64.604099_g228_i0.p1 GENE.NODE_318_length_1903_cov_64.604099_g228_i0~~NODE_318_length_1903_cov_64.604099_g228_i0.p1  ORF type:complete len:565 (+),score=129.66 NODE_318_length_1903_cov_64.604099_g228_i0:72-1766(+)